MKISEKLSGSLGKMKFGQSSTLSRWLAPLKNRVFGKNNEHIDFLMDSFYRLSEKQQMIAIASMIVTVLLTAIVVFVVYITAINRLDNQLNGSFQAIHNLREMRKIYEQEKADFLSLKAAISQKVNVTRIKPFFENKAKENGITLQNLNDQVVVPGPEEGIASQFDYVKIDMRMNQISIPRLMKFIIAVESSGQFTNLEDLRISNRYGTKLFFDAQARFRTYSAVGRGTQ